MLAMKCFNLGTCGRLELPDVPWLFLVMFDHAIIS